MSEHGGRLRWAAAHYGIPLNEWLDLSTGINPNPWPVPEIPLSLWQRLPEEEDELLESAARYYGTSLLLPVAGSQQAIQLLPRVAPHGVVGVVSPTYNEHGRAWLAGGHGVVTVSPHGVEEALREVTTLVVVNPNNPSGQVWNRLQLLSWREKLARKGGWLVVDEAFMDTDDQESLCRDVGLPGLVVLRSLGKFFGLAGARVGFLLGEESLLQKVARLQGPWPLSNPSRWLAAMALSDTEWQTTNRQRLLGESQRLGQLWRQLGYPPVGGTSLFQWIIFEEARGLQEQLAKRGILLRAFDQPASLRCGLPGDEAQWQRLQEALEQCVPCEGRGDHGEGNG
ncbi:MAG: threonine-phosphate decarboxylase [Magnetococcales bacterium]|nr:threonine-phosphate decarboxylase [Magnetococcales bacterium]NGZ28510.1 threonine-phosphate decarboxylase [Magnetococcales bacterium]